MKKYFRFLWLVPLAFYPIEALSQVRAEGTTLAEFDALAKTIRMPSPNDLTSYPDKMRENVNTLAEYAKKRDKSFSVVAWGETQLLVRSVWEEQFEELQSAYRSTSGGTGESDGMGAFLFGEEREALAAGSEMRRYVRNLDGIVIDPMYCKPKFVETNPKKFKPKTISKTPVETAIEKTLSGNKNLFRLGIANCPTPEELVEAYEEAGRHETPVYGTLASEPAYAFIPKRRPAFENPNNIESLRDIRNFLVLKDTSAFVSKNDMILELAETNYDLIIIDPFYRGEPLTKKDVQALKTKKLGNRRLVFASMNVAVAYDSRYYWKQGWKLYRPSFLYLPMKDRPDALGVKYWDSRWRDIIGHYFRAIVDLGFDGVVFDGLDIADRFQDMTPMD